MKIIFRDKKAPHQLYLVFDKVGNIVAGCNCGREFIRGKLVHAEVAIGAYKAHMGVIEEDGQQG